MLLRHASHGNARHQQAIAAQHPVSAYLSRFDRAACNPQTLAQHSDRGIQ
jgi:hypothetical protein